MTRDRKDVGYGNPPIEHRFRRGRSGNPAGRPRKGLKSEECRLLEHDELTRKHVTGKVTVKGPKGVQSMSAYEATLLARKQSALKGNTNAQRDIIADARALAGLDAAITREQSEQARQTYAYIEQLKKDRQTVWDEATARGTEPDNPWPHPDDILLFPDSQRWRFRGPSDLADVPLYEHIRNLRDLLIARFTFAARFERKSLLAQRSVWPLWIGFDIMLPLRWQIAMDCGSRLWELYGLSKRELRAEIEDLQMSCDLYGRVPLSRKQVREVDREVERIMRPLSERMGCRSLAELEKLAN